MRYTTYTERYNAIKKKNRMMQVEDQEAFHCEPDLLKLLGDDKNNTAILVETGVFYKTAIVDKIVDSDCVILYFSVSLKEIEKKVGCQSEAWNNYMRIKERENSICVDFGATFVYGNLKLSQMAH